MAKLPLFLLLWILHPGTGLFSNVNDNYIKLEIIGGNATNITEHPYQVSVWSNTGFRGSGAFLKVGWVVTTASMITGFDAGSLWIRSGSTSASSDGVVHNVTKVLIHPKFRFSTMSHDLALLKLKRTVMWKAGSYPFTIQLPLGGRLPTNATAMLSGWGSSTNHSKMSDTLLEALVQPVNDSHCQSVMDGLAISASQFCARTVDVYGPCWGDNGDLVVYEDKLYGLLSWNQGCYTQATPSIFTRMASFRGWIKKTIKKHSG